MAFKMNGSPAKMGGINGTAGHSSALKMKAESNAQASALKAKTDYVAMQAKSAKNDPRYGKMSAADYKTEVKRQVASNKAGKGYDAMGAYDSKGTKLTPDPKRNTEISSRKVTTKGRKTTTTFADKEGVTVTQKKKNLLNKGTTTKKASVMADGTTKKSKFKKDKDGDDRMRKTTTKGATADGAYVKKSKSKFDKDGVRKKAKTTIKSDVDGDGKVDRKFKIKTNDKKGTEKTVVKEGGRRTVVKTDKDGNTKVKSRRTLKGFLTGKGKKTKKEETPAKKALVGNQKNLPEHLKAKIDAAPGKMYGKSMAKKYDK